MRFFFLVFIVFSLLISGLVMAKYKKALTYKNNSKVLLSKIKEVTTFSKQANIKRIAYINKASRGLSWYKIINLPYQMDKESIRVRFFGKEKGKISQIILEDTFGKVDLPPHLLKYVNRLETLFSKKLDILQQKYLLEGELDFLRKLSFRSPFNKENENYQPFLAGPRTLKTALSEININGLKTKRKLIKIKKEIEKIDKEINHIRLTTQKNTNLQKQKWITNLYVLVNNIDEVEKLKLEVSYMIDKALWHPIYDVRAKLDRKNSLAKINLVTSGLLEQHTGEDWDQVVITFSTLSPIKPILPELNRWIFKERRIEAPIPRKRSKSKSFGRSKLMKKYEMVDGEMEASKGHMDMNFDVGSMMNTKEKLASKPIIKKERQKKSQRHAGKKIKVKGNMILNAPVIVSEYNQQRTNLFPLIPLENIFSEYGNYVNEIESLKKNQGQSRIYQFGSKYTHIDTISYKDSTLPAVQARGYLMELKSPFLVDQKSDESPLKVPLIAQNLKGKLSYFTIPKRDKKVYLKATTQNVVGHPILMGKAQIFMNGDFVSKTSLRTISKNSYFEINLGVDQNIETKRIVSKKSITEGMVFKDHATEVTVKIEVANHHNFQIDLKMKDHHPLSPDDDIQVKLISMKPKANVNKYGIIFWSKSIPPRSKKVFTFKYSVTHPEKFIVSEFN